MPRTPSSRSPPNFDPADDPTDGQRRRFAAVSGRVQASRLAREVGRSCRSCRRRGTRRRSSLRRKWKSRRRSRPAVPEGPLHASLRRRHRPRYDQFRPRVRRPRQAAEGDASRRSRRCRSRRSSPLNDVGDRPVLPSFLYLPAANEFAAGAHRSPLEEEGRSRRRRRSHATTGRRCRAGSWDRPRAGCRTRASIARRSSCRSTRRTTWRRSRPSRPRPPISPTSATPGTPRLRQVGRRSPGEAGDPPDRPRLVRRLGARPHGRGRAIRRAGERDPARRAAGRVLCLAGRRGRRLAASRVKVGDLLLVCDVGGGTTDFTLIGVTERDGDLELDRLAVGEHILLGGDNMDLALAYAVGATLPGGMDGLDASQKIALTYACRKAKETLFSEPGKKRGPGRRARPGIEADRRLGQDGAAAARRSTRLARRLLPRMRPDRPAGRGAVASA